MLRKTTALIVCVFVGAVLPALLPAQDSPAGVATNLPVSGITRLEQSREQVTVTFVPDAPLADDATYELQVDRRVTDLVGNDVAAFASQFTTEAAP